MVSPSKTIKPSNFLHLFVSDSSGGDVFNLARNTITYVTSLMSLYSHMFKLACVACVF